MSMYFGQLLGQLMRDSNNPVTSARGQSFLSGSDSLRSSSVSAAKSAVNTFRSEGLVSGAVTNLYSLGNSVKSSVNDVFSPTVNGSVNQYSSPVYSGSGTTVQLPEYLNADLAKAYGMDASTAYQEALSNTSYQRAVKDLQAAGLNPVLAAGQVAPAGGVYSAHLNGSGVDLSSGVSSAHGAYKFMSAAGGIVGTIIGALNGGSKGAYFGSRVGNSAGAALGNLIDMI